MYDKAELKRTFQSCVWLDECWVRAHPITRRVRYRRGHKPGEHQPQSSPKIPYLFAMTKDRLKMVRLEGGLTLAMFKSVMEKQICPWANEHLGKSWYLWMDSAGNAHGRDPSKPGGKAVRKIVHRLTGGRAEILEPPSQKSLTARER